jgi:UDP-N-acetylmuramoyl-L-alanyl-D-glutamate--2,6-diaminopimelate ligase
MVGDSTPLRTLAEIAAAVADRQRVQLVGENVAVSDVHMDSRQVTGGSLYTAIRGERVDGHDFVDQAVAAGAVAVAVEEPPAADIPHLLLEDTRDALGWMAAAVHGNPATELVTIGITGTNGKTTVAHMLAALAGDAAGEMAVIGTVSAKLDGIGASPRTTPEASTLQRMLRRLTRQGVNRVAIEVSSHAMEMGRVNGTRFDVVAFTNLSQDHLDYHRTMEEYFRAKAKLFSEEWAPHAVIWVDDAYGRRLAGETAMQVTRVGTGGDADVRVVYGETSPSGSGFELITQDGTTSYSSPLAGQFNVANAAIALTCAAIVGIDRNAAAKRLANMIPIPGRYNTVDSPSGLWVVVDYAHTPDAIRNVIEETRNQVAGKVIVVVGAGGDRDRDKRPLMGAAATTADFAIITNDNPRSEDPATIIEAVLSGITVDASFLVEPDRRAAIRRALRSADATDAVLILGKGHEAEQEFADRSLPFDDAMVAREEMLQLGEVQS